MNVFVLHTSRVYDNRTYLFSSKEDAYNSVIDIIRCSFLSEFNDDSEEYLCLAAFIASKDIRGVYEYYKEIMQEMYSHEDFLYIEVYEQEIFTAPRTSNELSQYYFKQNKLNWK